MSGKKIRVGTAPDCDIVVTDPYASTYHCQIIQDNDGNYWVRDLGSTNGTYLRPRGAGHLRAQRVYGLTPIPADHHVWIGLRTELPWDPQ